MKATPAVFDQEAKDNIDTSNSVLIPEEPCKATCTFCFREVTTFVRSEYNNYTWILLVIILYFYGIVYGIPILVISIPLCKNLIHSCPECLSQIFTKQFHCTSQENGFVKFKYEKCIIILRSLYVNTICLGILLFGIYLNAMYIIYPPEATRSDFSHSIRSSQDEINSLIQNSGISISRNSNNTGELSWEDMIEECGSKVIVENSAKANEIFSYKYHKKIVHWKGHYMFGIVNHISPLDFNPDHVINYYIRMLPSESIKNPDIVFTLDSTRFQQFRDLELKPGDPIEFTASLENLGNEWKPHHLHGISIKRTEEFIKADTKVLLFKGINFEIEGRRHFKKEVEDLIEKLSDRSESGDKESEEGNEHKEKEDVSVTESLGILEDKEGESIDRDASKNQGDSNDENPGSEAKKEESQKEGNSTDQPNDETIGK